MDLLAGFFIGSVELSDIHTKDFSRLKQDLILSFCSKVYVQFGRSRYQEMDERQFHADIPGRVSMAVYRAVKLRQLKIPCVLYLLK